MVGRIVGVLALTVALLHGLGRRTWCACGTLVPLSWDVNSSHNSQHFLDPYSFTHLLHGVLLYGLLWLLLGRRVSARGRFPLALALECGWEILENSPPVIERFRQTAVSFNYVGDSLGNSLGDLASCAAGYLLAGLLPVWGSVALVLTTEVLLYVWIRDSLLLAFLSLIIPRRP